ncbi:MAG: cytoplasmic protein [Deltaproteobacteria bacterium]|nr:cytoplasmic protein [Deltaproteobacteria bacterium]
MKNLTYSIHDDVFHQFPGYMRGVVIAFGVTNGESPRELITLLREAEGTLSGHLIKEEITIHPCIASWREAYRAFGAKPAKFRPSIEAMVRRVLNDNQLPSINALVDIGNIISLRHLVPVGGHAIDEVTQDIILRKATGDEEFTAFGSTEIEHPDPGEIIFAEGKTVLTRRWTWRQANYTLTLPSTKNIEFNIDGLPPVSEAEVDSISHETMELIERFCGGKLRYEILNEGNPRLRLDG